MTTITLTEEQLLVVAKVLSRTSPESPIFASWNELVAFTEAREMIGAHADAVILEERAGRRSAQIHPADAWQSVRCFNSDHESCVDPEVVVTCTCRCHPEVMPA